MVTVSATLALGENGYTVDTDISAINTEYNIDKCIVYLNTDAGTSVAKLSGEAGSKTTTCTDDEYAALSMLIELILRERMKTAGTSNDASSESTSRSAGALSASDSKSTSVSLAAAINNPNNSPIKMMYDRAVLRLLGVGFKRT